MLAVLNLIESPLVVYRPFIQLTGSINAALMLSQCLYWTRRTDDPDGWFHKTRDEWTEEIALSRWEQEQSRKALISLGILHEGRLGNPARMHYQLDLNALYRLLVEMAGNSPTRWRETSQLEGEKLTNKKERNSPTNYYKKITTKSTGTRDAGTPAHLTVVPGGSVSPVETFLPQEENPAANVDEKQSTKPAKSPSNKPTPKSPLPSAWLELPPELARVPRFAEAWGTYIAHRQGMPPRDRLTDHAVALALGQAKTALANGWDVVTLIEEAIVNGWKGFVFDRHRQPAPVRKIANGPEDGPRLKPGLN